MTAKKPSAKLPLKSVPPTQLGDIDVNINLNLDTLERETSEAEREPYRFVLKDRVITMTDASDLEWTTLMSIRHPVDFARHCMSEDDMKFMREHPVEGWKFRQIMKGYFEHYGVEMPEGKGDGSLF